ncbi:phytoene desaturase family protein [Pendulispora albinea]|uniref:NAD(P)/FAD-dependent oxidoreductase n=1 Tax=Pendulispora albinea TaxID=2741071 RepID=A0ABZ2MAM4_9BACT
MTTSAEYVEANAKDVPLEAASRSRQRARVPEHVDVAVIGSGLGGLTAAAYLAQRGLSVAVFESHYVAGGCGTHFVRGGKHDRYRFDVGLHYIGDCGPGGDIPRILRGVGIELDYAALDPDGFDTLVFPDLEFRIPANVELYRERLIAAFAHERRAIDRYVRLLEQVGRASRRVQSKGKLGARDALALFFDLFALGRNQNRTIAQVLDACGARDPKLRAVLVGQNGDYALPPSKVSAFLHLGLAEHYFRGAYYPKGGGQTIADRLAARIEACGGTIHLRRGVERIVIEDGHARGVRLEAKAGGAPVDVRARVVLSNADLRVTFERLIGFDHLPASLVTRTQRFEMAAALFMTFLGVRGALSARGMRPANYWQFDDYDMEGHYAPSRGPLRAHGCYITSASMKDPENALFHAPAGINNVEVMTVVPTGDPWHVGDEAARAYRYKDNHAYRALKDELEADMIARFDRLFPGVAKDIVYRESATPVTHQRYTRTFDGSPYGLAATPAQFMKNRPGYRGPIPGLYLCGGSTRAGHGIVGAMRGGAQAARRIAEAAELRV